ncbi:variant erythrocyte surface antigen-1 alpha subunit [Babesia bovis T2Bo]|uniref:Variant erythrocyte surface antigen-1, alpha subunit n=1 Tax=Babesia bovis TaxID=5865 RepID=A7AQV8_BABBO|nr:variant erythrocyte surface antigen-1 alpha subunit [Babesia bovis T2Bo]EDO06927.1 variant erythrocyte surface antigen-1 alpha subunit [Babesia bovis T2Bo]|eukprot:XP_001610495.1 variant erythrocyte surface antigen-1, alpha subunit [Babesia bovis T2Bo]
MDDEEELNDANSVKVLLVSIGNVVIQLGNAQQVLERDVNNEGVAVAALKKVLEVSANHGSNLQDVLEKVREVVEEKVTELKKGAPLHGLTEVVKELGTTKKTLESSSNKDKLDAAHHGIDQTLEIFKKWLKNTSTSLDGNKDDIANAINDLTSLCNSPKCTACKDHKDKCGKQSNPTICRTCLQPTTTGVPFPLQAFLEDRLPGFSCNEVLNTEDTDKYPPAASHLYHSNSPGQCCPLPMGFRGQFHKGSSSDMTGQRLYGILYFFSNENMMQSCVYTLVRVTAALSATTPQVLGDVFGFFRGGVGNKEQGKNKKDRDATCKHDKDPSQKGDDDYFCGWCASGLRDEVQKIGWIPKGDDSNGGKYMVTGSDCSGTDR